MSDPELDVFSTTATLWRWTSDKAPASWYFLTIEGDVADEIRIAAMTGQWLNARRGFGSAKVQATLGDTSWKTSVFPHKESGGWLLPVKAAVRKAEAIGEGDRVKVSVAL